jgi:hypothetical protein
MIGAKQYGKQASLPRGLDADSAAAAALAAKAQMAAQMRVSQAQAKRVSFHDAGAGHFAPQRFLDDQDEELVKYIEYAL